MDEAPTQEQLQDMWNEEAEKLVAGDHTPAVEPEAEAPAEPPPETVDPQPEAEQALPEPEDPLAGLPDVVKEKLAQIDQLAQSNAQLLQHVKSAEGRVAAMQRELQVAKVAQQSVAPGQAPSQTQIAAAAKNPEKWDQLREDFPEWSEAIAEYVSAQLGAVPQSTGLTPEQVAGYVQEQVAQTKAEMARAIEEARIEGKYEDWKTTVASPEFVTWFSAQPADVRSLAESEHAKDAIRMLDMYQASRVKPASEVKQERSQRLAAAATVKPGQTPPPKALDDMSVEELWNYEARRREKVRAERGY